MTTGKGAAGSGSQPDFGALLKGLKSSGGAGGFKLPAGGLKGLGGKSGGGAGFDFSKLKNAGGAKGFKGFPKVYLTRFSHSR